MPSERQPGTAQAQRLHPLSLLFSIGAAARKLLIPGILVLFASRGSNAEIWLMVLFVPAALTALAKYLSFRYTLGPEEMMVREGLVTRNERHIPYARVQNINLVQNPVHRWLGVAEVHVETAGGEKPEAVIRVLSLQAVERVRARVFQQREAAAPAAGPALDDDATCAAAAQNLLRLGSHELVLFGLISNRGMAVVAAAVGVIFQFDLIDVDQMVKRLSVYKGYVPESLATPGAPATVALVLGGLVVALLGLRLLSTLWALMRFHGFTLDRRGDDLRAQYGLFTRISATIPRHRIQLVSTRSTPLHRWCRRAAIQAETAGGGARSEESVTHRLWLAPLIPAERSLGFLEGILPEVGWRSLRWRPLHERAEHRVLRRSLAVLTLAIGAATALLGPWGLALGAPGLALVLTHARQYVKHTAYALTPAAVFYRSGWWVRRLSVVRFSKIQTVALRESPFDRRNGMASVQVDTAGAGRAGHRIDIGYLGLAQARRIAESLADEAGRTRFRW